MVHHVPDEKSKTGSFWLEQVVQYVNRLYKKNFPIPSVGKGGKGRGLFANFPYYFRKTLYIRDYIRDFFWKQSGKSANDCLPFPPFSTEKIWKFFLYSLYTLLNFMFKPKNHHFQIFIRNKMDHFLSHARLIKIQETNTKKT